jgi:phosphoesterase RecJ-like protein
MFKKVCKKIYKLIKKYDSIVIARHVGPDPDALGSQLALKETIATTFPNKKVYAVGHPASRFKYLGDLDGIDEEIMSKSLLIILDTPNKNRVDGLICNPAYSIKIDHHPFVEEFCNLEWIDDSSCSAAQLVLELIFNTDLKLNSSIASKIYTGIIADTNRFLFSYTSSKTFSLVSKLIRDTNFDFVSAYNDLYLRPLKEVKFEGYIINNMTITDNGFAYLKITQDMLDLYGVDAATAGNMVNNFNYIEEVLAWAVFTVDNNNGGTIRGNIRSRGPIINEVAANYGGGGHKLASGVRLKSFEEVDNIVADLDKVCALFK